MKKFFTSTLFWQLVAALLAIFMVATPFAIYNTLVDKGPSWLGLDVSWKMTLNYAYIKNWVWGKDIVYTYGPLAALSTRIGWGISRWVFLLFDVFLVINFYFVFADFLKSHTQKLLAVITLLCSMLVVNQTFGVDLSWVMLFFIIYWMTRTFNDQRLLFIGMLIVLTILAFYVKMNTGLIAIVLLTLHLINLFISKRIGLVKLIVCFSSLIILIFASAALFHVAPGSYIAGSLEIIKGYNDVMYLDESHKVLTNCLYVLFFAMAFWFLLNTWWLMKEKKYNLILYPVACLIYIFLLQKQSLLRNDESHLYEFFFFAPLLLICRPEAIKGQRLHLVFSLAMVLFVLVVVQPHRSAAYAFKRRTGGPIEYAKQLSAYNSSNYANEPCKRFIPQRVLTTIGQKTVDVFPWDSEYALENKLNYKPRPVFQSFSVYTPVLEDINYQYYLQHAPDMIIYNYDSIDGRYPFNDESLVNLFILNNYHPVDTFTSNERLRVLLQRNNQIPPLKFTPLKKQIFALTDTLNTGQSNFIKLDIHYNLIGKLKAFFSKPPHVQVSYMREDGKWFTYKTSPELLRTGIFIGELVTNDNEYLDLINSKLKAPVKKIKLEIESRYFEKSGVADMYFTSIHTSLSF